MAAAITHLLPEDVVVDILARLLVKSLKRFRCVSQSWCSLIQSREFITFHYSFNKNKACPLIGYDHDVADKTMVTFLSNQTLEIVPANLDIPPFTKKHELFIKIRGSCNGILCLYDSFGDSILLWNLATKEFKILPRCPIDYTVYYIRIVGFGYDSKRDDYKVVRIFYCYNYGTKNMEVALYSLTTDSWRKLDVDFIAKFIDSNSGGFYLNGFYHCWAAEFDEGMILSFDMSNEVFITTPFLDGDFGNDYEKTFFMEINGSVGGLYFHNEFEADKCYDVWVLGELGQKNSWTKLFTIGPIYDVYKPIGVGGNGEFFFSTIQNFLVCHHPNNQETKTLQFPGFVAKVAMYAESLVSLGRGTAFHH